MNDEIKRLQAVFNELQQYLVSMGVKLKLTQPHGTMLPFNRVNTHTSSSIKLTKGKSKFFPKIENRIGFIADEFLFDTWKDIANMVTITPQNWQIEIEDISIMIIVSVWRGLENEWLGLGNPNPNHPPNVAIANIINACKAKNIPVIFYSKEDPPHYQRFIATAKQCDYIFTTCVEKIDDYKKDCGHDRVWSLPFSCNPLVNNPIGIKEGRKENAVVFAGSWMKTYPERCKDMTEIFDGVIESGNELIIVDRNSSHGPEYRYPKKYATSIVPKMDHLELMKYQSRYNWAINLNSVKDSFTMFAQRLYELEGLGVLAISNYSKGVASLLPFTFLVRDKNEIAGILNSMTRDEMYERQICAVRHVMSKHTAFDRFLFMLEKIGAKQFFTPRKVAVVFDKLTDDLKEMFKSQTYDNKELISISELETRFTEFDITAFFSADMFYGAFYLEDMVNGFKYTDCDYITKNMREHTFVDIVLSKHCTIFWNNAFTFAQLMEMSGTVPLKNGYSIDTFNYSEVPPAAESSNSANKYKLSVIFPIFNNGLHLYGRSFSSLRRSTMFEDMEIILVDDGSTDNITNAYINLIAARHSNVRVFRFGDGGSGAAGRARNKGVELATAEYIAFLDPDNEAINDGYSKLYEHAIEKDCDIVLGSFYTMGHVEKHTDNYAKFTKFAKNKAIITDTRGFLESCEFFPSALQDSVFKKSLITENNLKQIVGAVGQDTFFVMQTYFHAKSISAIKLPIFIYYNAIQDSIVNTVGPKYFQKFSLLQQPMYDWVNKNGLLNAFMAGFWNTYTRARLGYLAKVGEHSHEYAKCVSLVQEILHPFIAFYNGKDKKINEFLKRLPFTKTLNNKPITDKETMIVCTRYPSEKNIYANMFVHSRVKSYMEHGRNFEVFSSDGSGERLNKRIYDGVNVFHGSSGVMKQHLAKTGKRLLLVHLMRPDMWEAIKSLGSEIRLIIWVHGADVQPLHRREFNYTTEIELLQAQASSDDRMACFRELFEFALSGAQDIHFVFVSQYFANEIMEDYDIVLPKNLYSIIHNPINTKIFNYQEKPAEQRKKIFSCRSWETRKYANDLSVNAILELSKHQEFRDMKFHISGTGKLFKELTHPLRKFKNVVLDERHYTHSEIATLHKQYGICLIPTRMDSQGVSRDEAMASGLVPITNAVAAIPEFLDTDCGILVPAEDYMGLSEGILKLYREPELFCQMSLNASQRVRIQSNASMVSAKEISLISEKSRIGGEHEINTEIDLFIKDYTKKKIKIDNLSEMPYYENLNTKKPVNSADEILNGEITVYPGISFLLDESGNPFEHDFKSNPKTSYLYLYSFKWMANLTVAYKETLDEKYYHTFSNFFEMFLSTKKRDKIWFCDHACYERTLALIQALMVFPETWHCRAKAIELLYLQGLWFFDDVNHAKNNHGLMTDIALLHLSVLFSQYDFASTWQTKAMQRVLELHENSFDNDGVNNENTIFYFLYNITFYEKIHRFASYYNIIGAETLQEKIQFTKDVMGYFLWQDGGYPPIGDSGVGKESALSSINATKFFEESGFCIIKDHDVYCSIKCGWTSGVHKHADDGSVTLRYKGHDILLDSGSFNYDNTSPIRKFVASTAGHSAFFPVSFDDLNRSKYLTNVSNANLSNFKADGDTVSVLAKYEIVNGKITVSRRFEYSPNMLKITDTFQCDKGDGEKFRQRFIFPESFRKNASLKKNGDTTIIESCNEFLSFNLNVHANAPATAEMGTGHYSPEFQKSEDSLLLDVFVKGGYGQITSSLTWCESKNNNVRSKIDK